MCQKQPYITVPVQRKPVGGGAPRRGVEKCECVRRCTSRCPRPRPSCVRLCVQVLNTIPGMNITNVKRLIYQAVNDEHVQSQSDVAVMAKSQTEAFISLAALIRKYLFQFRVADAKTTGWGVPVQSYRSSTGAEFVCVPPGFQAGTTPNAHLPKRPGSLSSSRNVVLASRR